MDGFYGLLFDAALGEADWRDAVEGLSAELGHATLMIGDGDPADPTSFDAADAEFDDAVWSDSGFRCHDQFDPNINTGIRHNLFIPECVSIDRRAVMSDRAMLENDFIREVMVPNRLHRLRLFTLSRDHDCLAGGVISPPRGADEADAALVQRLDRILPNLAKAVRLKRRLGRREAERASLGAFLDRLPIAVALVDRNLRVLMLNGEADRILSSGDGLSMRRGALTLSRAPARHALRCAVAALVRAAEPASHPPIVQASRPSALPAYELSVFPAIGLAGVPGAAAGAAMVVISDPMTRAALPAREALRRRFGLTPAEAAAARLLPLSLSRRQMADRLGLSENTVKSQLASVRGKLGVRSLREAAVLLAAPALR